MNEEARSPRGNLPVKFTRVSVQPMPDFALVDTQDANESSLIATHKEIRPWMGWRSVETWRPTLF